MQQLKLPGDLLFLLSASSLTTSSSPYLLLRLEPLQLKQNKQALFFHLQFLQSHLQTQNL